MSFQEFEKQLDELENSVKKDFREASSNDNDEANGGDSEDDTNELYCVACNKSFKSDKAYDAPRGSPSRLTFDVAAFSITKTRRSIKSSSN